MGVMLTNGTLQVPTSAVNAVCATLLEASNELLEAAKGLPEGPTVEHIVNVSNALADRAFELNMAVRGCNAPRAS
jgi:hypothetical protein